MCKVVECLNIISVWSGDSGAQNRTLTSTTLAKSQIAIVISEIQCPLRKFPPPCCPLLLFCVQFSSLLRIFVIGPCRPQPGSGTENATIAEFLLLDIGAEARC